MFEAFEKLPAFPGDPFFTLEPMAAGRVVNTPDTSSPPSMEELLTAARRPQEIFDFFELEDCYGQLPLLVLKTPDIYSAGFCYTADEYPALDEGAITALVAINPGRVPDGLTLRDIFLHEVAHVYTGEGHGFDFLSVLNAVRIRAGLKPSTDPYDVRDGLGFSMCSEQLNMDHRLAVELCSLVGLRLTDDMRSSQSALWGYISYSHLIEGVIEPQMTRDQILEAVKQKLSRTEFGST